MSESTLTASLQETLALFDFAGTPLTTSEVADRLDLGRRSTYDRLDRLVDHEKLDTKKVGASARVWWRPTDRDPNMGDVDETSMSRLVDNVPGIVYRCTDRDGWPMSYVSDAVRDITGYDPEDIVDGDVTWEDDVVHPGDARDLRTSIEEQLESGARFTVEYRIETASGDERWVRENGVEVTESDGSVSVLEGVITDVTDEIRSQQRLAEREQQFRSLVQATDEYAIFMLSPTGEVQTWNSGARDIKGYAEGEIVGEHCSTFYTETDREARVPEMNLARAAREGSTQDEGWRVRADGSRFWASVTITAIRDDDGDLQGFSKVTRDLTERREHEQRLRKEKAFVESLYEKQRDFVFALDHDGDFLRFNERLHQVTPYSEAALEDRGLTDIVPPASTDTVVNAVETVLEAEEWLSFEVPVETGRGETTPYEFIVSPLREGDELLGITGIGRDVTERKRKERRLERQRDELEHELHEVFDRVDDAFFALDEEWRFTHLNEQASDLLDRSAGSLLGKVVWEEFPEAAESRFRDSYEYAMAEQESVTVEEYYEPLDTWFEVRAHPSESGLSVYFRDVTERVERERELERYETIVETVDDGIYVVDEDGYFTQANETYAEMVGMETAELLGAHVSEVVADEVTEAARQLEKELVAGERETASLEAEVPDGDGGTWTGEATFSIIPSGDGNERVAVVRDVTERKERERELTQYETIVETVDDGIYALDADGRFVLANDALCELTGYSREELLGAPANMVHDASASEEAREVVESEDGRGKVVTEVETKDGQRIPIEARVARFEVTDGVGRCGVVRDISERQARERELEKRVRQQKVVTDLGNRALSIRDPEDLFREASALVAETLDNEYAKVLDLQSNGEELHLREGVGWDDGYVGDATISAVDDDSQAAYTLRSERPVVVSNLDAEPRFSGPDLLRDHDVSSGISTVIGPTDDPWGILGTHDTERKEFTERDVAFVQSVANILVSAIDRYDYEQALQRQRDQLRALNNLNEVVQRITEAVIDQSTRESIEATVCEQLAASESYELAWVGEVDVETQTVECSTKAGAEGYLNEITISVDPSDERSDGPTGRALRSGEMQTCQNLDGDPAFEQWAEEAAEYGFRSSAAIPIRHDDNVYGVLNVYASRVEAFDGREGAAFDQLGEIVGHAIAANERKRALMSDEVVELEFLISDVFDALDIPVTTTGTIRFDEVVPVEGEDYLVYGTASPDAVESLEAVVDTLSHWRNLKLLNAADAERRSFELEMTEPPVVTAVASAGGSVVRATIENGDFGLTVHLGANVEVRRVIDAIQDAYPDVELLKRRQKSRKDLETEDVRSAVDAELTDRQRTTLKAAFYGGFFEWPRSVSGEDVANSLDIAPSTFHQHLRKAERKVLETVFVDDSVPATS